MPHPHRNGHGIMYLAVIQPPQKTETQHKIPSRILEFSSQISTTLHPQNNTDLASKLRFLIWLEEAQMMAGM